MTTSNLPRRIILLSAALLTLAAAGCDSGAVTASTAEVGAGQRVVVQVTPSQADVAPAGQVVLAATVTGTADTAVTWSLREGTSAGAVSTAGLYTAPAAAGTYHVVATSVADPAQSAAATITVTATPSAVAVAVTPTSAAVNGCQTATFRATVTGASNTAVTWSVQEGATGGAVTTAGVYTAPRAAGTYHVVATSAADGTRTVTVPVTVTSKVLSVTLAPATVSLQSGNTTQLAASVTTTCGTFLAGN